MKEDTRKDIKWKSFFAHNHRYADVINGLGCGGKQVVKEIDIEEADGESGSKERDILRRVVFGVNFALIGLENQEIPDYELPLRVLLYDGKRYEKQLSIIKREVRKDARGLEPGEYLYGFKKDSKLHPVITFVLYSGEKPWDGAESLYEMIDFGNIPEELKSMASDYRINVLDIRRFEHTEVFKTDVKQVFDFIRCAEDREALLKLVEQDNNYKNMEEDAVDVIASYTNSKELVKAKAYQEGGKTDMCKAIRDLMEDSRAEGIEQGIKIVASQLIKNGTLTIEEIAKCCQLSVEEIRGLCVETGSQKL